jgi:hypothetical protein
MDTTFLVNGSPEDIDAKLRQPQSWVELIPVGQNGKNELGSVSVDSFTVLTPYAIVIHSIKPFSNIENGYEYKVSLGGATQPEATFDVHWTYIRLNDGGCNVRRRITNFQAHSKLYIPWTLGLRPKCVEENVKLQQMFS